MRKLFTFLGVLILALAACTGDAEDTASNTSTNTEVIADTASADTSSEAVTESNADTSSADTSNEAVTVSHRSAPIGINDGFHNDDVAFVGNTGRPQLIEFYTEWCPTCRGLAPVIHAMEADYWGQVDFVYLDRELGVNSEIVEKHGIRYQPVFLLLDADGNVLKQWFGGVNEGELRAELDRVAG